MLIPVAVIYPYLAIAAMDSLATKEVRPHDWEQEPYEFAVMELSLFITFVLFFFAPYLSVQVCGACQFWIV